MARHLKNKKGFSLPELLAVMSIMAILAAVSAPFLRDYMRDASADKSKVVMQVVAQGYKNFRTDYPKATLSGRIDTATAANCSTVNRTGANTARVLLGCRYVQGVNFSGHKFDFYTANGCGNVPADALACIRGRGTDARYGASYRAWVTAQGKLCDTYSEAADCPL